MALSLNQQTAAQFAARLRTRYLNSSADECARLAQWILDHLEAGDFTETQLRNAFGLTLPQWTTLKAKLTALRVSRLAVLAAAGE